MLPLSSFNDVINLQSPILTAEKKLRVDPPKLKNKRIVIGENKAPNQSGAACCAPTFQMQNILTTFFGGIFVSSVNPRWR